MTEAAQVSRVLIRVDGIPKAQPRPGVNTATRRGYNPDKTGRVEAWKTAVLWAARTIAPKGRDALKAWGLEDRALEVVIDFRLVPPARLRFKQAQVKPDLDNLGKAVLDALESEGSIKNDSRVVRLVLTKRYADDARTAGATVVIAPAMGP